MSRGTFTDLTRRRFGRLRVLGPTNQRSWGNVVWRCLCDCDSETLVTTRNLTAGHVRSCGCAGRGPRAGGGRRIN